MGDENSLQGRTQAHKHELASSTGGYLSTGLTGMTNLSNGSLVYGDAAEIVTELPSGNLNDVLTMGAAVPAWAAAGVPTSFYTELVNSKVVGASANIDESWLGTFNILKIFFYGAPSAANKTGITFNSVNNTEYTAQDFDGNVFSGERSAYLNDLTTGDFQYTVMDVYNIADKEKQTHINSTILNTGTSAIYKYEAWQAWENTADLINSVQIVEKNTGVLQTYLADSSLIILGGN